MSTTLLSQVPLVRDGADLPFVIGVTDETPCLEVSGFELRGGPGTCHYSLPVDQQLRLNTTLQEADGNCYLFASVGPALAEWWSLVTAGRPIAGCPILTAAGAGRSLLLRVNDLDLPINVTAVHEPDSVVVALGSAGDLDDAAITIGINLSAAICNVALRLLVEYRTMVQSVPDVDVVLGRRQIPFADLIDAAALLIPTLPGEIII